MTVGWFDPDSLEFPGPGKARIKVAVLDENRRSSSHWIEIETKTQALDTARALREQARYGISGIDRPLEIAEGAGHLAIDHDGTLSGTLHHDGAPLTIGGRIDLRGAEAPPPGNLDGDFILLGYKEADAFQTFRLGAEIPGPEIHPGPNP